MKLKSLVLMLVLVGQSAANAEQIQEWAFNVYDQPVPYDAHEIITSNTHEVEISEIGGQRFYLPTVPLSGQEGWVIYKFDLAGPALWANLYTNFSASTDNSFSADRLSYVIIEAGTSLTTNMWIVHDHNATYPIISSLTKDITPHIRGSRTIFVRARLRSFLNPRINARFLITDVGSTVPAFRLTVGVVPEPSTSIQLSALLMGLSFWRLRTRTKR